MTQQRRDKHSTEFGLWLRQQPPLDSIERGLTTTDIDYIWHDYKITGKWMILEEKRGGNDCTASQHSTLELLHKACRSDPKFCGVHLLQFENTSPDDGRMWLDKKEITCEQLLLFLRFEIYNNLT